MMHNTLSTAQNQNQRGDPEPGRDPKVQRRTTAETTTTVQQLHRLLLWPRFHATSACSRSSKRARRASATDHAPMASRTATISSCPTGTAPSSVQDTRCTRTGSTRSRYTAATATLTYRRRSSSSRASTSRSSRRSTARSTRPSCPCSPTGTAARASRPSLSRSAARWPRLTIASSPSLPRAPLSETRTALSVPSTRQAQESQCDRFEARIGHSMRICVCVCVCVYVCMH